MAIDALVVTDSPGGNYVEKMTRLLESSAYAPGSFVVQHIMHDEWCGILRPAPIPCDCDPDLDAHLAGGVCRFGYCGNRG